MGKQFTATAVMILVEEGKLSLDDKISKYFTMPPRVGRILLCDICSRIRLAWETIHPNSICDVIIRKIISSPHQVGATGLPNGSKWDYSNLGYVTLGILIHKVTGKFYGDFLAERIFQAARHDDRSSYLEADIVPNRAAGYRLVDGN